MEATFTILLIATFVFIGILSVYIILKLYAGQS